jgi:hypothetical protein
MLWELFLSMCTGSLAYIKDVFKQREEKLDRFNYAERLFKDFEVA